MEKVILMSAKKIYSFFLIIILVTGSYFLSVVAHEMLHVMLDMPKDMEKAMCINLNPYTRTETNATIVAWVDQSDLDVTYTEQHYGIYFLQGIFFMLFVSVGMLVLVSNNNKPPCFGSREFNHFNRICKGCDDYNHCEKEYDKRNGLT